MIKLSEQQIIEQMTGRLAASHPRVDAGHVDRIVREEYARFEGRPIRDFIPVFVERHAKAELTKLGSDDRPFEPNAS